VSDPFGWVGAILDGKYRVGDVVGEGGFGVIHAGQFVRTGEAIAIKFLKLDGAVPFAGRERFLAHFVGQGKLLSRLAEVTPGVVRAIDVGAATAPRGLWTPYLVLEWLDGVTLDEELAGRLAGGLGGRTLREAIDLLEPAARAIAVAHDHGVVHRDVKPGNLVVTEIGGKRTLKILDFGVAKIMRDVRARADAASTAPPHHAFSPPYGAPEQFEQRYGATGPWTDVFALALLLVEVVAGRPALSGEGTGALYRQVTDPSRRPTLRTLGVESSDEVERVLQRALAVEPRHRHRRVGEFWEALIAASRAEPVASVEAHTAPARVAEMADVAVETPPDEADWDLPEGEVAVGVGVEAEAEAATELEARVVSDRPTVSEAVEASPAPTVRAVAPARGRARVIAIALAVCGLLAGLLAMTTSVPKHGKQAARAAVLPGVSTAPAVEGHADPAIRHSTPMAVPTEATDIVDAMAPTTIAAASADAVTPALVAPPRPRASTAPRDPACSNCATHPDQCGKFSLPQGRGDCYCGCGTNSHCALSAGRSTGPCVPNGTSMFGAP
jgi:serine/threonine-protein kinase